MKYLPFTITVSAFLLLAQPAFASTLYFSSPKQTVSVGEDFTVSVRLNTGSDKVNAYSAFVTFPNDDVEVKDFKTENNFSISAEEKIISGEVRITKGNITPLSGDMNLASIEMKALKDGPITLGFGDGSAVPSANDSSDTLREKDSLTIQVGSGSNSGGGDESHPGQGNNNHGKDEDKSPKPTEKPKQSGKSSNWQYVYLSLLRTLVGIWVR